MSFRPTRRLLQACLVSLLLGIASGFVLRPAATNAENDVLYFMSSGHRLSNEHGFLSYWRASDGPGTIGVPISEPLLENGRTVQYFERARLELHPEYNNAVLRGRLGAEYAEALWRDFARPHNLEQAGRQVFGETGYTLGEPFAAFWQAAGGVDVFGFPISEPEWEYVGSELLLVQYFERARLEQRPGSGPETVIMGDLGRSVALLRGISTTSVDALGARSVDAFGAEVQPTAAPPTPIPPTPIPPTPIPAPAAQPAPVARPTTAAVAAAPRAAAATNSGKYIIVDLSDQWLYAYEGDRLILDAPVSTGRDGFNTPVGNFAIYHKQRSQTMRGCAGGECWNVPNVPHAMYIVGGVALHGTYWHNQFGSGVRRSHGCINLPLDAAARLFAWAGLGTSVSVRW